MEKHIFDGNIEYPPEHPVFQKVEDKSIYADLDVKELDALLNERDLEKGGKKGEKIARWEVDDDLTEDMDETSEDSEEGEE